MGEYLLSRAADVDLSQVYRFTFAEFGERQADHYFESLEESLTRLAANPKLGREATRIREGYRVFVHSRHSIYYRQTARGIFVVRVLGPGMEPEGRLSKP